MVALEHAFDHMKAIAQAGWRSPPSHPDLEPAHEALMLREHFTEMLRLESVRQEPADFRRLLQDSEQAAQALEVALRQLPPAAGQPQPPDSLKKHVGLIAANCKKCHETYRDIPLGEK
jgi:hypothetical protein